MKNKRRKLIDLNNYTKGTVGEAIELKKKLQDALLPNIFEINSMEELLFEALKHLKPVNKSVKKTSKSIENNILKVFKKLNWFNEKTKASILINGIKPIEKFPKTPIEEFQEWVLGFEKVPAHELVLLKRNVEQHLKEINELIKKYEQDSLFSKFLEKREKPRNHHIGTMLDFYTRCLEERQIILDYFLIGVYDRAIEKSRFKSDLSIHWFFEFKDYPYEIGRGLLGKTLDYQKINCVSHRIPEILISEVPRFKNLYSKNKKKFYAQLFKRRTQNQIFKNIGYYLNHIPLINDRFLIFKELKRLFKNKKWLAFYSLALPQVEGLFSEMITTANPDKKTHNSLPDKVKSVRPDYSFSDTYFDYYQYVLPNQRNRFSHSGFDQNFELKSYDLLTDLEHILNVFYSLNNPFVNITQIIIKRDYLSFTDPRNFSHYFSLINQLHKTQKVKIESELDDFNNSFLIKDCSLEYLLSESIKEIQEIIPDLLTYIEYHFIGYEFHNDFISMQKPKIDKWLREDSKFHRHLENFYILNLEKIKRIYEINDFFLGVKKHLFNNKIAPHLEHIFQVWETNKKFIKRLKEIEIK